jgi:predicted transcriptional regulator
MAGRKTTRAIAKEWGVSRRDARRHFAGGTLPGGRARSRSQKKETADQVEEAGNEPIVSTVLPDLEIARDALQRIATADEFTDLDLEMLRAHAAAATALLNEWLETVAAAEGSGD